MPFNDFEAVNDDDFKKAKEKGSAVESLKGWFGLVCDALEIPHETPLNQIYNKIVDLKIGLHERDAIIESQLCAGCDHSLKDKVKKLQTELDNIYKWPEGFPRTSDVDRSGCDIG